VVAPVQTAYEQARGRPVHHFFRLFIARCLAQAGVRSCPDHATRQGAKRSARPSPKAARAHPTSGRAVFHRVRLTRAAPVRGGSLRTEE
jgi:hypothetical protein